MKQMVVRASSHRAFVLAVVLLVVSAGTVAAVQVLTRNPNPVTAAEGSLSSSPVTVDAQSLTYSGTDATGLDVTLNNTDTADHTTDLHFALRQTDGTIVEQTTVTGVTVGAGSTTTATWTFAAEHAVDTFSQVEVTVEQTG